MGHATGSMPGPVSGVEEGAALSAGVGWAEDAGLSPGAGELAGLSAGEG